MDHMAARLPLPPPSLIIVGPTRAPRTVRKRLCPDPTDASRCICSKDEGRHHRRILCHATVRLHNILSSLSSVPQLMLSSLLSSSPLLGASSHWGGLFPPHLGEDGPLSSPRVPKKVISQILAMTVEVMVVGASMTCCISSGVYLQLVCSIDQENTHFKHKLTISVETARWANCTTLICIFRHHLSFDSFFTLLFWCFLHLVVLMLSSPSFLMLSLPAGSWLVNTRFSCCSLIEHLIFDKMLLRLWSRGQASGDLHMTWPVAKVVHLIFFGVSIHPFLLD
jgi:hypothetical protein